MKATETRKALAAAAGDIASMQGQLGGDIGSDGPLWRAWREWTATGHQQPAPSDGGGRTTGLPASTTERAALTPDRVSDERDRALRDLRDGVALIRRAADTIRDHARGLNTNRRRCVCGKTKDPRAQNCQPCAVARSRTQRR